MTQFCTDKTMESKYNSYSNLNKGMYFNFFYEKRYTGNPLTSSHSWDENFCR